MLLINVINCYICEQIVTCIALFNNITFTKTLINNYKAKS